MAIERLIREFLAAREAEVKRGDLSPRTVREYRQPLEKVLLPFCEREGVNEASQLNEDTLDRSSSWMLVTEFRHH